MNRAGRPWLPLALSLAALVFVFAIFETTETDLFVQDRLYDFAAGRWIVDAQEPTGRALFYNGPKALIIALAVVLLVLALGPARLREAARLDRRGMFIALVALAGVPSIVGYSKAHTNVFCPYEIQRYGGDAAYVRVLEGFPEGEKPERRGLGFPAGHASGGFALVGLLWVRRSRAWKTGIVLLALTTGWWMGAYQMAKGAHYLSHTLLTMVFALSIAFLLRCTLPCGDKEVRVI
jgi:membrane-associated PAP2 superfamily phosphatase